MIIILGATGQVGSHLLEIFYKNNHGFKIFPISSRHMDFTKTNILGAFFKNITSSADIVINCSAFNDVDGMQVGEKRSDGYAINALMMGELYSNCECPIIHISTDYVFDRGDRVDTDKASPLSEYGNSKAIGEQYVLQHKNGYVFRTSCVYSNGNKNFVSKIIAKASEYHPLNVDSVYLLPNLVSTPNSAKFIANGIYKSAMAILSKKMPNKKVYHLTTTGKVSRKDFATMICHSILQMKNPRFGDSDSSCHYRPKESNLIFSEELCSIGVEKISWEDDFCDYFMHDLYRMKKGFENGKDYY